ncbi:hypothetical protein VM1G_06652 [Cytospora mali]|uniref:Uncharacterized protein n=1 Tax=Cytospora mali TaxID=578113 RepID=A0A194W6F4_CYTMA|nr:hypothetical protein VM1G_06652 [Valsa mali]
MAFGASVSALLETYDNCLSLLKAFKQRNQYNNASRKLSKASKQQALLKHSLKADRKKVERAYTSRLSVAGSSFEKGDSKSRSALSKVLKKLNAAIAKLMRLASQSQTPAFDYQSLMTLSNSSRVQAIKTFDQLSHRLGSKPSGGSAASTASSSKTARPSTTAKTTKSSRSKASKSTSSSATSKPDRHHKKGPRVPRANGDGSSDARKPEPKDSRRDDGLTGTSRTPVPTTPVPDLATNGNDDRVGGTLGRRASLMNRFSFASMSSDSTRLGEIPERKWHRRYDPLDGSLDEYNTPIMYPLRPYQPQAKERKFLGLFRRG